MDLNDLNNINQLTDLKQEYINYDKIKNEYNNFLNKKNSFFNLLNIIILKKNQSIINQNDHYSKDDVLYILNKKKLYDFNNVLIGTLNKNTIKFIDDEKKAQHLELKNIISIQNRYLDNLKKIKNIINTKPINDQEKKEYESLPEYNDINLNSKISDKIEFNTNIINKKDSCKKESFELKSSQIFLKNFISKKSRYNSLLLFHGTGTGKTCSGITIAENFKGELNDQKTIILCPKNIIQNWKDTIFDTNKKQDQCAGNRYYDKVINLENIENEKKIFIRNNYDIMGYRKFSNLIINKLQLDVNKESISQFQIDILKKNFDNRLIIIDEVHNIRDETEDKDIMKLLKIIAKYAQNTRLILLSATPMFNSSFEIINLLNIMLINDNRQDEILKKQDIFDENGKISEKVDENGELPENKLNRLLRGYISYSRGENFETYPIRLYPYNKVKKYKFDYKNNEIDETNSVNFLKLFPSKIDKTVNPKEITQTKVYLEEIEKIKSKPNLQIDDEIRFMQICNIVYPFKKYFTGDMGLKLCTISTIKDKSITYRYQKPVLNKLGPIFDEKNIGKYSKKIQSIVNIIKKSNGIVFVYSQYLKSGIIPLALALEHVGYAKFNSEQLLSYDKKQKPISYNGESLSTENKNTFQRGNYIILSSDEKLSSNMINEINISKSDQNYEGQKIKIILGTSVASEGIDFKNIRMIHIMDPWHHLNRLEQIVGRGIRYCSHNSLQKQDRNVMVFMHVLESYDQETETVDIELYKQAQRKAINIGYIENILKKNSIDCNIFNDKSEQKKLKIKLPYKNQNNETDTIEIIAKDEPYSKICSYSEKCEYQCTNKSFLDEKNMDTLDVNLFKPVIYNVCKYIKILYNDKSSFNLSEIIENLRKLGLECNNKVVYLSLKTMISEKNQNTLITINDVNGYIEQIGDQYIFKQQKKDDKTIPFTYRYKKQDKREKYIYYGPISRISNKSKETSPKGKDDDSGKIDIDIDIEDIKKYFIREENSVKFINDINIKYLKFFVLERLTLKQKETYLTYFIKNFDKVFEKNSPKTAKKSNEQSLERQNLNYIYEHFQRNLIYSGDQFQESTDFTYDKTNYNDIKKNKIQPIGFYLFNGESFVYWLKIKDEIKQISKDSELNDKIQSWLNVYKKTENYKNRYIDSIQNKIWGYMYTNAKKQYLFKLVEENNKIKPGFRATGHKNCNGQGTGDLSKDILIKLNKKTDKIYINDVIDDKLYSKKSKYNRYERCMYLEMVMRQENMVFNYDNILFMKI